MRKILIIEDEEMIREMIFQFLSNEGYEIVIAENGKQGLEVYQKEQPSVILLDLAMPVMDGLEFLDNLSPIDRRSHSIIVMTGHGGDEQMEQCYLQGIHSFLRKPVNLIELSGQIRHSFDLLEMADETKRLNRQMTTLLHNLPDLVLECDPEYKLTYISDNVEQILGYKTEDLLGKQLEELLKEEDRQQFGIKVKEYLSQVETDIAVISLSFLDKMGKSVPMQLTIKQTIDEQCGKKTVTGIGRETRLLTSLEKGIEKIVQNLEVRIDRDLRIVYIDESAQRYFPADFDTVRELSDFSGYVYNPSLIPIIEFAFKQKEDLPFPIEVKLIDRENTERHFNIQFKFEKKSHLLRGYLTPLEAEERIVLIQENMREQEKRLKSSISMDESMKQSILKDSWNLSLEIIELSRLIEPYAFPLDGLFNMDEYGQFIRNKNLFELFENMRLLSNKIHGLKGTTGFLISESKQLCHQMEELIRPTAEKRLVLTVNIQRLLKETIFKVQEMLEEYQKEETEYSIETISEQIDKELRWANEFMDIQGEALHKLLNERVHDDGRLRKRKTENYLSVSQAGYEQLAQQVKSMFYMFSRIISEEHLIQAGNLYNEFLDTHQKIKKIPLDLTRYERLIPSIAKQYSKEARFQFDDHNVRADREFWNALHEILNHSLKNAVIHGIESPKERKNAKKNENGTVRVELREDALNIFISISDDGRGMNPELIRKKAIDSGVISKDDVEKMTTEETLELIFLQGVSTVDQVDDNAGRGVGMNAVQEAMRQFQGTVKIHSKPGEGTQWDFRFPKSNVSLPCFIVTIGQFPIAIPEDSVEAFHGFQQEKVSTVNDIPVFRHLCETIPLIDTSSLFDEQVKIDEITIRRILILNPPGGEKIGLVINNILHHSTLPVLPLPDEYRQIPGYIGVTIFGNSPVPVLDATFRGDENG